jgi:hypothetical protein
MIQADRMSCDAMKVLALEEKMRQMRSQAYMHHYETCVRQHQFPDRQIENNMLFSLGSFKDVCLDPNILQWQQPGNFYTMKQNGPWVDQHVLMKTPFLQRFDEWTRAKGSHPQK